MLCYESCNDNRVERCNSRSGNLLTAPWTVSNTYTQVVRAQLYMCKSCATHQAFITCNMLYAMQYKETVQLLKFDIIEIAFILALLYWLKPLANEGYSVYCQFRTRQYCIACKQTQQFSWQLCNSLIETRWKFHFNVSVQHREHKVVICVDRLVSSLHSNDNFPKCLLLANQALSLTVSNVPVSQTAAQEDSNSQEVAWLKQYGQSNADIVVGDSP